MATRRDWTVTSTHELRVADGEDVTFVGRPDGRPVHGVLPLEEHGAAIILIDPNAPGDSNVFRVLPDGRIEWRAELPDDSPRSDRYSSISRKDDRLLGFTGYGYWVELDPETGAVLSSEWHK